MEERSVFRTNGFVAVLLILGLIGLTAHLFIGRMIILGVVLSIGILILASGIIIVQPNQGLALTFFGKYVGSVRESGLWFTVPLCWRNSVSLRVRNFNSAKLKVNDVEGNPVDIAAVVVFRVIDSAKSLFDVDDYEKFVEIQSETALRHVATKYPYDIFDDIGYSLRGNAEEVAAELAREVQMALQQLQQDNIVELDEERKAAMVNNLMVAIVSDRSAHPVINVGSVY